MANQWTRRERLKSAPYLRLKTILGTIIGNIWKKDIFLKKSIFGEKNHFFQKMYSKKSHNAEKLKKRPFRLIKRF